MTELPVVTVVIPAYNAEEYIRDAIDSILRQGYPKIEIVVVNDGSTDDTGRIVGQYGSRVRLVTQQNSGGFPGVPRNRGMHEARGEFVCFLDADDMMVQGRVARQVAILTGHPDMGLVFSDYRNFDRSGQADLSHFQTCFRLQGIVGGRPDCLIPSANATCLLLHENIGLPSSAMIRRSVLEQVSGFATEIRTSEDFHFFYRIARRFSIGVVNQLGALRRLHDKNISASGVATLYNYIACRSDLLKSEPDLGNRMLLEEFIALREIDLARAYANQRQWGSSLRHNLRGIRALPVKSGRGMRIGLRTVVRTAAIALGLKSPSE